MNLFQIILKQLRQRMLSTVLTILSVALGVALAITILIFQREGDKLFGQSEFGFDILLGPKGSKLQLVLNTVYQLSEPQGTIPYRSYTDLTGRLRKEVDWALPVGVGDNYRGYRIVATQPKMVDTPELGAVRQRVTDLYKALPAPEEQTGRADAAAGVKDAVVNPPRFDREAVTKSLHTLAEEGAKYDPELVVALTEATELLNGSEGRKADCKMAREAVGQAVALVGGPIAPKSGSPFKIAQGRAFEVDRFEAIVGSEVAKNLDMKLGHEVQADHGVVSGVNPDHHNERWKVVGFLAPTGTAFDRVIFIPLTSFFAIGEHEEGMAEISSKARAYDAAMEDGNGHGDHANPAAHNADRVAHDGHDVTKPDDHDAEHAEDHHAANEDKDSSHDHDHPAADGAKPHHHHDHHDEPYTLVDGHIKLKLDRQDWRLGAIIVRTRDASQMLLWDYMQTSDAMAVNPANEIRQFSDTFLRGSSLILLLLAILVTIVAAVSILVSIYNSIASRRREIAILRALGATRRRILSIICLEAGVIGLIGSAVGLALGLGLAAVGSAVLHRSTGNAIAWYKIGWPELLYLAAAVVLAVVSGLVPAMKAYRTPVATNLVAD